MSVEESRRLLVATRSSNLEGGLPEAEEERRLAEAAEGEAIRQAADRGEEEQQRRGSWRRGARWRIGLGAAVAVTAGALLAAVAAALRGGRLGAARARSAVDSARTPAGWSGSAGVNMLFEQASAQASRAQNASAPSAASSGAASQAEEVVAPDTLRTEVALAEALRTAAALARDVSLQTLFCWMVIAPHGYEAGLARESFKRRRSIFACDAWTLFSDDLVEPVPVTRISKMVSKKASWGSYLNTQVFLNAWEAIAREGKYRTAAWTVKADADTVWFPMRLREQLQQVNCEERLYVRTMPPGQQYLGPLEVFSRPAIDDFEARWSQVCKWGIKTSGEDGWISDCMDKLGVKAWTDLKLLVNDFRIEGCIPGFVAYHPYKDLGLHLRCFDAASGSPPPLPDNGAQQILFH